MDIKWYGQSCFRITAKRGEKSRNKVTILIDPFDQSTGLKFYKENADILLITHDHKDHSNIEAVGGRAFLIDGPGEYEVENIFIQGIFSYHDNKKGEERGANTIYVMEAEGMKVCHLGDLGQKELTDSQLKEIGEVDILMIPVGGVYTIDGKEASKIISQIEPKLIIPMHYKIPGLKIDLEGPEDFLKAMGVKEKKATEKLTISKSNISEDGADIVPLKAQTKNS